MIVEAPDFIRNGTHFIGERIVGWRRLTEPGPNCTEPCFAPGSSPHSHGIVTGVLLVTECGVYEFDVTGIGVRASCLHPTDFTYPQKEAS